jgi:hypothetical protein
VDPLVIRQRMEELELTPDRNRTLGEAAAEILGVPYDETFEKVLTSEVWRTTVLCRTHYTKSVAMLPNQQIMAAALVQGITLAQAIRLERAEQLVMERNYWRERAITLGADEDEYDARST